MAGAQPAAPVAQPVAQPVYTAPVYAAPVPAAPVSVPGKGLGIASMVLGIVALVFFCTSWFAIACALVGCILGAIGLKKAKDAGVKNGMAVAGLVCSVIALALDIIIIAAAAEFVSDIYALAGL